MLYGRSRKDGIRGTKTIAFIRARYRGERARHGTYPGKVAAPPEDSQ